MGCIFLNNTHEETEEPAKSGSPQNYSDVGHPSLRWAACKNTGKCLHTSLLPLNEVGLLRQSLTEEGISGT